MTIKPIKKQPKPDSNTAPDGNESAASCTSSQGAGCASSDLGSVGSGTGLNINGGAGLSPRQLDSSGGGRRRRHKRNGITSSLPSVSSSALNTHVDGKFNKSSGSNTRPNENSAGITGIMPLGVGGIGGGACNDVLIDSSVPGERSTHDCGSASLLNSSTDADGSRESLGIRRKSNDSDSASLYCGYNSGDEHIGPKEGLSGISDAEWEDRDRHFVKALTDAHGYQVTNVAEDGACLFRSISLQLYGDQEMHEVIRQQTMDYILKNSEYFAQFVTEDIGDYVSRKRNNHVHGNHVEIQAISEIYNRPIELYVYQVEPVNIFNSDQMRVGTFEPLRLSYQRGSHYNAIVNPYKASVGVGLGLAGYSPTRPERIQMHEAVRLSEDLEIEQTMFEDKLKTTDWEATNNAIEEQIARESYIQWCKDNMRRSTSGGSVNIAPQQKCSDDDNSSFGSDSEINMDTKAAYSAGAVDVASHYAASQRSFSRRRKRRRATNIVAAVSSAPATKSASTLDYVPSMAGPSKSRTNDGGNKKIHHVSTPLKHARLDASADDYVLPRSSASSATITTDNQSSAVASTSSASATSAPESSLYRELLEASIAGSKPHFGNMLAGQLTEEQMLHKALQLSRLDFMTQFRGERRSGSP